MNIFAKNVRSLIVLVTLSSIFLSAEPGLDVRFVSDKNDLQQAINQNSDIIYILDKSLYEDCEAIVNADTWAMTCAIVAVGAAAFAIINEWNPAGWGASFLSAGAGTIASLSLGTEVLLLISTIGATTANELYKGYKMDKEGGWFC